MEKNIISQEEYDSLSESERQEYVVLDELNKKTYANYAKAAMKDTSGASAVRQAISGDKDKATTLGRKASKRQEYGQKAIDKAMGEEVETLEEARRLLNTYNHDNGVHSAKVYKDPEWNEHVVKYFEGGKHLTDADSFHSDANDAHDTAKAQVNMMAKRSGKKSMQKEETVTESIASETLKANSRPVGSDPKSKIEAIKSVIGAMHSMKKDDLTKWYTDAMALIGKEASSLPSSANDGNNQATVKAKPSYAVGGGSNVKDGMPKLDHKNNPLASVREDVEDMFGSEELSEEFKEKATTLFEAGVNARVTLELARLEEDYENLFEEKLVSIKEDIEKNLDTYLDYVVEKWLEENRVAVESSLRNEIMEEFIGGLKNLFSEHYIEMPEEKIDVVESLAIKVEKLESSLDEAIAQNSKLKEVIAESERVSLIGELSEDLNLLQSEKFSALAEGVSFDGDLDSYRSKLSVVKETYFNKKKAPITTNLDEETFETGESASTVNESVTEPYTARYAQAMSRNLKN
jgi:hypothetical protein